MFNLKIVITSDNKYSISDMNIEAWYQNILSSKEKVAYIATGLQFNRIRLGIMQKDFTVDPFYIDNDKYKFDDSSMLCKYDNDKKEFFQNHPNNLFTENMFITSQLLKSRVRSVKT
jgi:hypothetical protein